MSLKRILFFLFVAFVIFFVIQSPAEAARVVKVTGENAGEWFTTAAQAFSRFLGSLI